MESEFWKSSIRVDGITLHLAGFKGESKAVYRTGDIYRRYVWDDIIGMRIVGERAGQEDVTWKEAEEFLK